jgi:probable phosphoglycerate mutase
MTRLVLIRHGETDHNRGQLTLGRADVPLNARGQRQANALAASFASPPIAIYSSPLGRCKDTAASIERATRTPTFVEDRLIEMDVGVMEHLTRNELRDQYPEFLAQWLGEGSAIAEARMPGGETLAEVQERAWAAVGAIVTAHPAGEVAVVTHNFVILTVLCMALGLPLDRFRKLRIGLASKAVLDMTPGVTTLISWNDNAHLRARGLV